jgi:hypothetical protein
VLLWPQADAGSVMQLQSFALWLIMQGLQSIRPPDLGDKEPRGNQPTVPETTDNEPPGPKCSGGITYILPRFFSRANGAGKFSISVIVVSSHESTNFHTSV